MHEPLEHLPKEIQIVYAIALQMEKLEGKQLASEDAFVCVAHSSLHELRLACWMPFDVGRLADLRLTILLEGRRDLRYIIFNDVGIEAIARLDNVCTLGLGPTADVLRLRARLPQPSDAQRLREDLSRILSSLEPG